MQIDIHGSKPRLGLFSGIHGDEWRIISSVKRTIVNYQDDLGSYVYIPKCSPSAVNSKTRTNEEGNDLNRTFIKNPQDQEAKEIISLIKPFTFDLCVDFHEDTDLNSVYVYDSANIEGSTELAKFRNQVLKITTLYSGVDDETDEQLGGKSHEGYRVSNPPEKDENGNYEYLGFFDYWALIEKKTKRWMTLELPIGLPEAKKDKIVDIFFSTLILPLGTNHTP